MYPVFDPIHRAEAIFANLYGIVVTLISPIAGQEERSVSGILVVLACALSHVSRRLHVHHDEGIYHA